MLVHYIRHQTSHMEKTLLVSQMFWIFWTFATSLNTKSNLLCIWGRHLFKELLILKCFNQKVAMWGRASKVTSFVLIRAPWKIIEKFVINNCEEICHLVKVAYTRKPTRPSSNQQHIYMYIYIYIYLYIYLHIYIYIYIMVNFSWVGTPRTFDSLKKRPGFW